MKTDVNKDIHVNWQLEKLFRTVTNFDLSEIPVKSLGKNYIIKSLFRTWLIIYCRMEYLETRSEGMASVC